MNNTGRVEVYKSKDGKISVEVRMKGETVWLTQPQIAGLFRTDRSVITKHIGNIFRSKELDEKSNVQKMHVPLSDKPVKFYNLDVVISVGYRVNSARATQFRIWATNVLKRHLIEGYTLNERRLKEQAGKLETLRRAISLIGEMRTRKELDHKEAMGLLEVISDYNYALDLLDDYDKGKLKIHRTSRKAKFKLTYGDAANAVDQLKTRFGHSPLFGMEKDRSFRSSIAAIYQTFHKKELYPSIEEKAANLLYFMVKNHSFVDGNKRIAASIFLWFLEKNGLLYEENGEKLIADNALVALTLLIAESKPADRNVIVTLAVNLINRNN